MQFFIVPSLLFSLLIFILGLVVGQSVDLGWGLPLGTSLAFVVAALSLFVTVYQAYAVRRHNRLLVRPHLIFDSQFNSTTLDRHQTYQLRVKNVGLGPAVIDDFTISFEGAAALDPHSLFEEWVKLVNKYTPANGKAHCGARFLYKGHAVDKGEEEILLEVSFPTAGLSFMQGREIVKVLVKKIDATINYKCHYGLPLKTTKKFRDEEGGDVQ